MLRTMCKSKIHRATVTKSELFYEGSLTLDTTLIDAADMKPFEKIQVLNLNNGERLETYLSPGESNTGVVCLNGPAARRGVVGDEIIIISYADYDDNELEDFKPKIVYVDKRNRISNVEKRNEPTYV
ncbi:MAG: aspartate 1-decarboxylase [Bacteroidetes bacterium]|nr:aspartate 1-decarboxylase [Bacteroidota bacterium]